MRHDSARSKREREICSFYGYGMDGYICVPAALQQRKGFPTSTAALKVSTRRNRNEEGTVSSRDIRDSKASQLLNILCIH